MIVNELVTKFKFDVGAGFKNFNRQLEEETRIVDRQTNRWKRLFRAVGKDIAAAMKHRLQVAGTKAVMRDLERIKGLASGLKTSLKNFAIGGAAAATGGAAAAVAGIIKAGVDYERTMKGFEASTKSVAKANEMYRQGSEFALKFGVDLNKTNTSILRLNNLGLSSTNETLETYGDIVAANPGKTMMDFAEAVADAVTGENERLKEFAIKSKKIGEEVEYSLGDAKVRVKNDAKSIEKALQGLIKQRFAGTLAKQAETTGAAFMRMKTRTILLANALWTSGVNEILGKLLSAFDKLMPSVSRAAILFVKFSKVKVLGAIEKIPEVLDKIKTAAKLAAVPLALVAANMVGLRVIGLAASIYKVAAAISVLGIRGWLAAGGLTALSLSALAVQVAVGAAFLVAIGGILDFNQYLETGDSWLLRFTDRWPVLQGVIKNVYTMLESFWMGITDLSSVTEYWGSIAQGVWDAVKMGFQDMLNGIVSYFRTQYGQLVAIVQGIKQNFVNTWNLIKESAVNAGNSIRSTVVNAIQSVINFLAQLPAKAVSAFNGMVNAARNAAANMPVLGAAVRMLPGFATGGMVPQGYPNDSFVAGLTSGEVIVPPLAVRQIQQGNPAGFAKVAQLANAPMPSTPTYSMSAATVSAGAGGMGGISINAPINQVFNMNTGNQSPVATARAVAATSTGGIRKELDLIARQTPQRIAAT